MSPGVKQFMGDRNKAILTLDEKKIRTFMKKYRIQMPLSRESSWHGVHKARANIPEATPEQIAESKAWLAERGSSPEL